MWVGGDGQGAGVQPRWTEQVPSHLAGRGVATGVGPRAHGGSLELHRTTPPTVTRETEHVQENGSPLTHHTPS